MESPPIFRSLRADETDLLREALLRTVRWRELEPTVTLEDLLRFEPKLGRYVDGFGRAGDLALVAEWRGSVMGIGWYRLYAEGVGGLGFVDERTPELGLAVWPEHRGKGIGTSLLDGLIENATKDGYPALSLCVSDVNLVAQKLYRSRGFSEVVHESAKIVMIRRLGD